MEGAQVKIPFAQVAVAQGIADLDVVAELVVHLLVGPAVGGLEELQAYQDIDRHVGAGGYIGVENGEGLFVQAAEEFPIKGLRLGVLEPLPQRFGQFVHVAGQGDLQVTGVLAEPSVLLGQGFREL